MISHKQLVDKARFWLISAKSCNPVFTEKGSAKNNEFPDAIGWSAYGCFVIECKASVADFWADQQKDFRINGDGMGDYRYYLMPYDIYQLLKVSIPEGWGVVTVSEERMYPEQVRLKGSNKFTSNIKAERNFLRSRILEIQRFGA